MQRKSKAEGSCLFRNRPELFDPILRLPLRPGLPVEECGGDACVGQLFGRAHDSLMNIDRSCADLFDRADDQKVVAECGAALQFDFRNSYLACYLGDAYFHMGELDAAIAFWETKPTEELYDLQTDRWEIHNLADSPAHRAALEKLRKALDAEERATRDVGFMPEYELHRDEKTITAYERGRDPKRYDFDRVYAMARAATDRAVPLARVRPGLADKDPIVRYWAATGMLVRGKDAVTAASADLAKLLDDLAWHQAEKLVPKQAKKVCRRLRQRNAHCVVVNRLDSNVRLANDAKKA